MTRRWVLTTYQLVLIYCCAMVVGAGVMYAMDLALSGQSAREIIMRPVLAAMGPLLASVGVLRWSTVNRGA